MGAGGGGGAIGLILCGEGSLAGLGLDLVPEPLPFPSFEKTMTTLIITANRMAVKMTLIRLATTNPSMKSINTSPRAFIAYELDFQDALRA